MTTRGLSLVLVVFAATGVAAARSGPLPSVLLPALRVGQVIAGSLTLSTRTIGAGRTIRGAYRMRVQGRAGSRFLISGSARFGGISAGRHAAAFDPLTLQAYTMGSSKPLPRAVQGFFYNQDFWGDPLSAQLRVGQTWRVTLPRPWQYGPAGSASVRVVKLSLAADSVTLQETGSGVGPSAGQIAHPPSVTMSSADNSSRSSVVIGRGTWTAAITLHHGIVAESVIDVRENATIPASAMLPARHITLENVYTLVRTP